MGRFGKGSLRVAIPALFAAFVIPTAVILTIYSVGLSRQVREQLGQNTSSLLRMFGVNLTDEMERIENYLAEMSTSNTAFLDLGSESDMTRAYLVAEQVSQSFSPIISSNPDITCILLYSAETGVYHDVYGVLSGETGVERVSQKARIRETMMEAIKQEELTAMEWSVIPVEDQNYLYRMVRRQEVYCVCLMDLGQMSARLGEQYNLGGQLLFTKGGGALVEPQYESVKDYIWSGIPERYKVVYGIPPLHIVEDNIGVLSLACVTPYQGVLQYINVLQILLLLLTGALVLALPVGYRYLRNYLIRPMDELMEVMGRVGAGDMMARASEEYTSVEFRTFSSTFNAMIHSIRKLQIEVYEKKLESERAQLATLKLQIRPHFYLNCLKSIYALAALGRNEDVQEKVVYLSRHLRYVFTELGDEVSLRQELDLCKNYVCLLGIGTEEKPQLREDIDPRLLDFKIPPVTLLTVVENSRKHSMQGVYMKSLEIFISAHVLTSEEGSLINIMIKDNGPGFTKESLEQMKEPDTEHVGLNNLQRRLRYYYGETFMIAFSNNDGAQVDLFIPGGGNEDESVDCG